MTTDRDFDRELGSWFDERATVSAPDGLLERGLARVAVTRQRPGWLVGDRSPAPRTTRRPRGRWLLVAATVAVGTGIIGAALVGGRLITPKPGPTLLVVVPNPTIGVSPAPEASPSAQPEPAVYVFNKGTGTAAECGESQGGCIPRMWMANLDGSGAHELLPGQTGCQRAVAWSPDGTRLLFTRSDCRRDPFGGMMGADRFYLTDASGSEPRLVDTGCVDLCVSDYDAVFSADGLRILFVRTKSIPPPPSATDPVTGKPVQGTEVKVLASIDLATSRVTELGYFDEGPGGSDWPRSDPVWSPDRTHIVFTSTPLMFGPHPPVGAAVLVADADGRNVHQLSASGGAPAWSADGARIAFRTERYSWKGTWKPGVVVHPFFDIETIRPDGTDLVSLTSDGVSLNPEWSPDGRIWFINSDEPTQFWVMDADGSNAAELSAAQVADKPPFQAWQVQPTP